MSAKSFQFNTTAENPHVWIKYRASHNKTWIFLLQERGRRPSCSFQETGLCHYPLVTKHRNQSPSCQLGNDPLFIGPISSPFSLVYRTDQLSLKIIYSKSTAKISHRPSTLTTDYVCISTPAKKMSQLHFRRSPLPPILMVKEVSIYRCTNICTKSSHAQPPPPLLAHGFLVPSDGTAQGAHGRTAGLRWSIELCMFGPPARAACFGARFNTVDGRNPAPVDR